MSRRISSSLNHQATLYAYDGNGNVTHLTDAFGNTETATGPAASTNKFS